MAPEIRSTYEPIDKSAYRTRDRSTYEPIDKSTYFPRDRSTYEPICKSIYEPRDKSTHEPIDTSTYGPRDRRLIYRFFSSYGSYLQYSIYSTISLDTDRLRNHPKQPIFLETCVTVLNDCYFSQSAVMYTFASHTCTE